VNRLCTLQQNVGQKYIQKINEIENNQEKQTKIMKEILPGSHFIGELQDGKCFGSRVPLFFYFNF
jgi:hypothetical protein